MATTIGDLGHEVLLAGEEPGIAQVWDRRDFEVMHQCSYEYVGLMVIVANFWRALASRERTVPIGIPSEAAASA